MLWIPITVAATVFQVGRNASQRSLLAAAGPWGATLARFLFGLPFAVLFLVADLLIQPQAAPHVDGRFFLACGLGAAGQILATAAMLVSMRRSSFALGTVFQQSSIPLAGLLGLLLGEQLGPWRWVGLAMVSLGLAALGWPRRASTQRLGSAALLGLCAGAGFAVSSNAVRAATLSFDRHAPVYAALAALVVTQTMQSAALGGWLLLRDRAALRALGQGWRSSLPAGFFGAAASALWFTAFALAPAGPVRAVGVTEAPLAALAGRRLFAERLHLWQSGLMALIAAGVVLAALG